MYNTYDVRSQSYSIFALKLFLFVKQKNNPYTKLCRYILYVLVKYYICCSLISGFAMYIPMW